MGEMHFYPKGLRGLGPSPSIIKKIDAVQAAVWGLSDSPFDRPFTLFFIEVCFSIERVLHMIIL